MLTPRGRGRKHYGFALIEEAVGGGDISQLEQ
jgi:hypothetical protein